MFFSDRIPCGRVIPAFLRHPGNSHLGYPGTVLLPPRSPSAPRPSPPTATPYVKSREHMDEADRPSSGQAANDRRPSSRVVAGGGPSSGFADEGKEGRRSGLQGNGARHRNCPSGNVRIFSRFGRRPRTTRKPPRRGRHGGSRWRTYLAGPLTAGPPPHGSRRELVRHGQRLRR